MCDRFYIKVAVSVVSVRAKKLMEVFRNLERYVQLICHLERMPNISKFGRFIGFGIYETKRCFSSGSSLFF